MHENSPREGRLAAGGKVGRGDYSSRTPRLKRDVRALAAAGPAPGEEQLTPSAQAAVRGPVAIGALAAATGRFVLPLERPLRYFVAA